MSERAGLGTLVRVPSKGNHYITINIRVHEPTRIYELKHKEDSVSNQQFHPSSINDEVRIKDMMRDFCDLRIPHLRASPKFPRHEVTLRAATGPETNVRASPPRRDVPVMPTFSG